MKILDFRYQSQKAFVAWELFILKAFVIIKLRSHIQLIFSFFEQMKFFKLNESQFHPTKLLKNKLFLSREKKKAFLLNSVKS